MLKFKAMIAAAMGHATLALGDPGFAAQAINQFGADLHQRLAGKADQNLCISPYSIQTALAMTFAGADGATRDEMAKVLHFGSEDIHASFGALQIALNELRKASAERAEDDQKTGAPKEPLTLSVANRLFGKEGYPFRAEFRDLLNTTYGAPLEEIDFTASAEATKHINGWVEEQTRDRIRDLLPTGVIDHLTRLVLVNAVYLKVPWAEAFRSEATKAEPFHVRGGAPQSVPTMIRRDTFGYARKAGYTAVTIPYFGGDLHFVVLLPDNAAGLPALEKKLTGAMLSECAQLPEADVILHLPKFKLEPPSLPLKEVLKGMGLKTAFDEPMGSADFTRMTTLPKPELYISEAMHKTFIAVDEKGTEAAAATAVVVATRSAAVKPRDPIEVKVDRPFLFAVQHRPSGACLFLGRVVDPR